MFRVSAISTSALLRNVRFYATKKARVVGKKVKVTVCKVTAKRPKKVDLQKMAKVLREKAKKASERASAEKRALVAKKKAAFAKLKLSRASKKEKRTKLLAAMKEKRTKLITAKKEKRAKLLAMKKARSAAKKEKRTKRIVSKKAEIAVRTLTKHRKGVVAKPWKAMGNKSLPNKGMSVFVKDQFAAERQGKEAATVVLKRLVARWKAMDAVSRAPFVATAQKNAALRGEAKAKVSGLGVNAYSLFVKENYGAAAQGVTGSVKDKFKSVGQKLSAQWKALSDAQRSEYCAKAVAIKTRAASTIDGLIAQRK